MLLVLAALSAALAIGAGAFGAHGAPSVQAAEWLRTGGVYQLVHAVAVVALLGQSPAMRWPGVLLLAGAALFAGTLYAMAFGAPRWLGAVTPIGGAAMIVGWVWAAWAYTRA
jgi:uncharacterized membrane protein YgdD (TMEM256/DUF423 family)